MMIAPFVVIAGVMMLILRVRPSDVPAPPPPDPAAHLEERKQVIYENLRDLNFEFRLGKLSDADYEKTKTGLQNELAQVLAEIDRLAGAAPPKPEPEAAKPAAPQTWACPKCGAQFDKAMKFCGECGAPMTAGKEETR
ncbi:MAG: zinc ribbon domain-containing protein [Bryobacteraceae bacterium]|nr:zinc ribbon domain-containing protein [Bryobacteraceae bacterium]